MHVLVRHALRIVPMQPAAQAARYNAVEPSSAEYYSQLRQQI